MKEITLEEALKLVRFNYYDYLGWQVCDVSGLVHGDVLEVEGNVFNGVGGHVFGKVGGDVIGDVKGNVVGSVRGDIHGSVRGDIHVNVHGKINHRPWQFIETPKEKFQRLLQGTRNQELIDAFNQLENN